MDQDLATINFPAPSSKTIGVYSPSSIALGALVATQIGQRTKESKNILLQDLLTTTMSTPMKTSTESKRRDIDSQTPSETSKSTKIKKESPLVLENTTLRCPNPALLSHSSAVPKRRRTSTMVSLHLPRVTLSGPTMISLSGHSASHLSPGVPRMRMPWVPTNTTLSTFLTPLEVLHSAWLQRVVRALLSMMVLS